MNPEKPLTREQIRRIDTIAIEQYDVPGVILMENAGRNAARAIRRHALSEPERATVAIVCGSGNNAGDGFVIARHLANLGARVELYLAADPARLAGDAAVNYRIAERMGIPQTDVRSSEQLAAAGTRWRQCDVLVDAILGTGFVGQVRPPLDEVIRVINAVKGRPPGLPAASDASLPVRPVIVAIDLPSGLDADTGSPGNATVRADLTITMVARKIGFDAVGATDYTGPVIVVDIGAPRTAIDQAFTMRQ
jgi:NAD(P)H-hydrate epimerase